MDLETLDFPVCWETPPAEILRTIETAQRLSERKQAGGQQERIPLLVNSNYYIAYHALKHAIDTGRADDRTFCEWGSGLGVVTCIASQLGFRATGIEIEASLCELASSLAEEMRVDARFYQGSYRSETTIADADQKEVQRLPYPLGSEFSQLVYAYPWPAEEAFIETLFKRPAKPRSLLVTYHGGTTLRVRKCV